MRKNVEKCKRLHDNKELFFYVVLRFHQPSRVATLYIEELALLSNLLIIFKTHYKGSPHIKDWYFDERSRSI